MEFLDFLPRFAQKIPVISQLAEGQLKRYERLNGKPLNLLDTWWTPPLSPREAWTLEANQIRNGLGLHAMVSLTDHDTIDGTLHLQLLPETKSSPVSVEWTVPFGPVFFHVGVHNLPFRHATSIMDRLARFTRNPREECLGGLLAELNALPDVLIILNHPLWDEIEVGPEAHTSALHRFLAAHATELHALELNGLRPWKENAAVTELAKSVGLPVISGGDRHGCDPNVNVNLTNASTFEEFVGEVRRDKISRVLFMDQYREPYGLRLMQGVLDAIRDYPEFPEGRRRWTDRVFFRQEDGTVRNLSSVWESGGPRLVQWLMASVRLLESRHVKQALRYALAQRREIVT